MSCDIHGRGKQLMLFVLVVSSICDIIHSQEYPSHCNPISCVLQGLCLCERDENEKCDTAGDGFSIYEPKKTDCINEETNEQGHKTIELPTKQKVVLGQLNSQLVKFERDIVDVENFAIEQKQVLRNFNTGNVKAMKHIQILLAREALEVCGRGFILCGDRSRQCVHHLAVCDGYSDCVNGYDENPELCRIPFYPIRLLRGVMVRSQCADVPSAADALLYLWSMQKIQRNPDMPSRPMVLWKYVARFREKDGTQVDVSSVEVTGTYNYATKTTQWRYTKGSKNAAARQEVGSCTETGETALMCNVAIDLETDSTSPCVYAIYQTTAYQKMVQP